MALKKRKAFRAPLRKVIFYSKQVVCCYKPPVHMNQLPCLCGITIGNLVGVKANQILFFISV